MSKQAITFVTDDNYLPHAKAFMVNCRNVGKWSGDFCAITPGGSAVTDLRQRGIDVFEAPNAQWDFMTKLWAFTPYFDRWEQVLCIDLDVLVQAELHPVFDQMAKRLPKIICIMEDNTPIGG